MPNIRIAAAGAFFSILLFVSGIAAGSATAQSATGEAPGKPLQLLKIVERSQQTSKPRVKAAARSFPHSKFAGRVRTKPHRTVAQARRPRAPAQTEVQTAETRTTEPRTAEAATPAGVGPTVNPVPPVNAAAAEFVPPQTSVPAAPTPSELVVAGQTVQVASPNEVNEIDLAANDTSITGDMAPAKDAPDSGATNASLARKIAEPEPNADSPKTEIAQPSAEPAQPQTKVGSISWIMQVMAALGGAVTAGSLAWFLIGSTPQRTYG